MEAESKQIAAVMGENIVAIHHIGSTTIPDIYAKPVIDFLIEVKQLLQKFERAYSARAKTSLVTPTTCPLCGACSSPHIPDRVRRAVLNE